MDDNSDVERSPNPIDVHVGARIRLRRRSLGISQERLAEDLGLTFQQVQKYERGANRVSASKLYEIARSLQIPVAFFFDDLADPSQGRTADFAESAANPFANTFLMTPEGLELAELFPKIRRPRVRRRILELVRSMADEEDEEIVSA